MRRREILIATLAGPGLAACVAGPPTRPPVYAGRPAIILDAATFDVEDRRQPLPQSNFIDERRGNELATQVRSYLHARYQPGGGSGTAIAEIVVASLTERLIENRAGGVVGLVTGEPTYQLDAKLAVKIVLREPGGTDRAYAQASVERSRQVRAGAGVVERDTEGRKLMVDIVDQLDPVLEQAVRDSLQGRPAA